MDPLIHILCMGSMTSNCREIYYYTEVQSTNHGHVAFSPNNRTFHTLRACVEAAREDGIKLQHCIAVRSWAEIKAKNGCMVSTYTLRNNLHQVWQIIIALISSLGRFVSLGLWYWPCFLQSMVFRPRTCPRPDE